MFLLDRAAGSCLFVKSQDRQELLFPGVIYVAIQSFPLLLAWLPYACAVLGDESERMAAQKCLQVLLGTAADDGNIHVRLLAEPVQQSFNAGIRRRRPGVKFDFAQRAVVVQEESDPFTGRDSLSDLLARLSRCRSPPCEHR